MEELEAAPAAMAQVDLGPARPEPASGLAPGTARYRADLRGAGVDASTLRDLQLVPVASAPSGGGPPSVSVEMQHGDDLVVLGPAQPGEPRLSATVDPAGPPRALADALRAVTEPGLAERFESGVLDPPPSTVPPRPGLSPEEAAACAASCAPGFNVVWAPVGTDATRVVAEALASLAGAGHSVLLVSTVGHAVDRAVLQAAERLSAAVAGRLVRVGPPSLPEVADHPFLPLARARERRAEVHGEQVEELERRIAALRSEPDQLVLERAERLLAGFDPRRYERARALVDGADALARLERRAAEQELALEAARAEREQARAALAQAEAAVAEAGEAQDAYRQIDRLEGQMGTLQEELGEAKDHVRDLMRRLEASRNAVADFGRLSPVRRATRLGAGGRVRAARREAEAALLPAWEKVVGRERAAAQLREQIERELRRAGSISREEIDRRGQARAAARERLEAAGVAEEERERAHGAARAELERARQAPAPTEQDRRLVLAAEEQGLPELAGRIGELRAAARAGGEELARLDAERGRLSAATDALTSATVAAATVVATTMDRLAADEAVLGRGYDHVVVDQATAALPPAVVLAATLARRGVTLVGDPLQGGPASVLESRRPASVPVSRWLLRDCFALLGLDRPERLLDRPGCSALAPVRDLGPDAAELANRVAYQGRLPAGEHQQRPHPDDGPGELVLVDVAPFGELARIRTGVRSARREWWPVGALLAGAIATHHLDLGQPVALMAPHAAQLRLTEAAVLDAGLDERVEVGWPPRFQGRRFQVGVLDLVEGGRDRGWIAGSRLDGTRHELRGLRLFNLGVTRAERTYLLADRAAIERAERGPLAHVGDLWREGRVGLAGAGRFLSLERRPPADADPEAAAPTLLALEGSDFFDRLEADLAAAGGEVWVWSPQLATRPSPVIGWLADAAARGCQVTVFVKPPHEHRPNDERRLGALRAAGLTVVAIYGVAERMVVVDRRRSFIGNVNVLATPHERDEGMVLVEGGRFARALLEVEQAEAFRAAPSCARHPAARCYAQYYRRGHEKGWFWTCPWCGERRRLVLAPESAPPSG